LDYRPDQICVYIGGIVLIARRWSRATLAVGVLVATLTGCASKDEEAASGPQEVVFLSSGTAGPFYTQIADGFRFGAGQVAGITAEVAGPKAMDPVQQMKILQELVAKGVPSISMSMPFSELSTDAVADAAKKGVRLIAVDTPPLPGSPVELFIGNDNERLGKLLADTVADQVGLTASGKVVLGSPRNGVPQLDARVLGFREQLRERLPKLHVIGPLDTAEIPAAAAANWADVTEANKDAVAFVSVGANAALLAGLRAKQKAKWLAASFDIDPAALAAVKQGGLVIVSPEQYLKGTVTGWLQAQYLGREEKMPAGWLEIPGVAITPKNVDEYIARDATTESRSTWYAAHLNQMIGKGSPHLRPLSDAQQQ
jgi:ribose transport system substrate-binding protein